MRPIAAQCRQQGFTLVELLVAMSLMLVVFGTVLTALGAFGHAARTNDEATAAEDQARSRLGQMVYSLRNVTSSGGTVPAIVAAGPTSLVFNEGPDSSSDDARASGYCVDSAGNLRLQWRDAPSSTGPDGCSATGGGWMSRIITRHVTSSAEHPLFTYHGDDGPVPADAAGEVSDPTAIRTVGIDLQVATDSPPAQSHGLRTAVDLRGQPAAAPAVDPGDVTSTCDSGSHPALTLNLGLGALGAPLAVRYSHDGVQIAAGSSGKPITLPLTRPVAQVVHVVVTNVLGISSSTQATVTCP